MHFSPYRTMHPAGEDRLAVDFAPVDVVAGQGGIRGAASLPPCFPKSVYWGGQIWYNNRHRIDYITGR